MFKYEIGAEVFTRDGDEIAHGVIKERYYADWMEEEELKTSLKYLVVDLKTLDGEHFSDNWTYQEISLMTEPDSIVSKLEEESNEKIAKLKADLIESKKK